MKLSGLIPKFIKEFEHIIKLVYYIRTEIKKCTFLWTCVIFADMPGFCKCSHILMSTLLSIMGNFLTEQRIKV